jgi:hypothetical protein
MQGKSVWPFTFALFVFLLGFTRTPAFALQFFDDFSTGSQNWFSGPTWSVTNPAPGICFYQSDCPTNDQTWKMYLPVGYSWQFQSDINFQSLYGASGIGSLALAQTNYWTTLLADVMQSSSSVRIQVEYYDTSWHTVLDSGSLSGSAPAYHVIFSRPAGSNYLQVAVQGTNGFFYTGITPTISTSVLDSVSVPGFRANSAVVDFANFQFDTPATNQNAHYLVQATNTMNDLLSNFWIGDALTGHVVNTHGIDLTNTTRPVLWERGMLLNCIDDLWRATGDPTLQERMQADWNYTTNMFSTNELQVCGAGSHIIASDDAGWTARMYLQIYDDTGNQFALQQAIGLINNAFNRWLDDQLGGGMWYDDSKQQKSLYEVSDVLDSLHIYEVTGDQSFYDRAMQCYTWMETYLLRTNLDNLYWCNYTTNGPDGKNRPYQIAETNSVVFFGGNMAMAVLHARLYQMTGNTNYLNRAVRTVNAIFNSLLTKTSGVYLDDRDAKTDGTFAGDWARGVLTLPGIDPKHWTISWTTADSVYDNARTTNGYYGGSWSGPAEGPGSPYWVNGVIPQILAVSCSSANMILAAGVLEGQYTNIIRPRSEVSLFSLTGVSVTNFGHPYWPYQLQTSTNMTTWNAITNFYLDPMSDPFNFISPINGSQMFFRATPLVYP